MNSRSDEKMFIMKPVGKSKSNSILGSSSDSYGSIKSTNIKTRSCDSFRKHFVSSNDTLQGIALKYGTTTEELRRINRLWHTDSLHLRQTLLVPLNGTCSFNSCDLISEAEDCVDSKSNLNSTDFSNEIIADNCSSFLSKIDSSIQKTKQRIDLIRKDKSSSGSLTHSNRNKIITNKHMEPSSSSWSQNGRGPTSSRNLNDDEDKLLDL